MKKILFVAAFVAFDLSPLIMQAQTPGNAISTDVTHLLRVTYPIPNGDALLDGFTYDKGGHLIFIIRFSRPVDTQSVVVRNTLQLSFSEDINADAKLSWSADKKTLTIITKKTSSQLLRFRPDDGFKITLKGTRRDASTLGSVRILPGGVKADNGHFLDGDNNWKEGGDYVVFFRIIG